MCRSCRACSLTCELMHESTLHMQSSTQTVAEVMGARRKEEGKELQGRVQDDLGWRTSLGQPVKWPEMSGREMGRKPGVGGRIERRRMREIANAKPCREVKEPTVASIMGRARVE